MSPKSDALPVTLSPTLLSDPAATVLTWLTAQRSSVTSHREIHQTFRHLDWAHTSSGVMHVMHELEDLGFVRNRLRHPHAGVGRPSVEWELIAAGRAAHIAVETRRRTTCLRTLGQLDRDLQALNGDTRERLQGALDEIADALRTAQR